MGLGASDSGGWARTRVNPTTGSYDLHVATSDIRGTGGSTWAVRAFVDPRSGYLIQRPRIKKMFLPYNCGAGSNVTIDVTLVHMSSFGTISGTVTITGPTSMPLPGARVIIREFTSEGSAAFQRWTYTDRQGRYQMKVPAGVYKISAHFGENLRDRPINKQLIPAAPTQVTITAQGKSTANLVFRLSDARVSGNVTYMGNPSSCLGASTLWRRRQCCQENEPRWLLYTRPQSWSQLDHSGGFIRRQRLPPP